MTQVESAIPYLSRKKNLNKGILASQFLFVSTLKTESPQIKVYITEKLSICNKLQMVNLITV